jgi:hypothetical protein
VKEKGMSKASKEKRAGRSPGRGSGNVTIDLGEAIDRKLRAAGLRAEVGKSRPGGGAAYRPGTFGGYRPGMFGGYRPSWHSRPWLGQEAAAVARYGIIPAAIAQVKTTEVLTGVGLGILGNRALIRLTPLLIKNNSKILHEGLGFLAGIVPMFFKRNATTLGVALPGAVMLGVSLVDLFYNAVLGNPTELTGALGAPRADAAMAARQRLAAIQQRINLAQAQPAGFQRPAQRVVAQAQFGAA